MESDFPWAVHIPDGVLSWPWLAGGFVLAGLLTLLAAWRIRDEEVPRVALLTAAFFVASSIHLKLGPREVTWKGMQYLLGFALPNFYFHVVTAYDILRHRGVPVGKRDFLGPVRWL